MYAVLHITLSSVFDNSQFCDVETHFVLWYTACEIMVRYSARAAHFGE